MNTANVPSNGLTPQQFEGIVSRILNDPTVGTAQQAYDQTLAELAYLSDAEAQELADRVSDLYQLRNDLRVANVQSPTTANQLGAEITQRRNDLKTRFAEITQSAGASAQQGAAGSQSTTTAQSMPATTLEKSATPLLTVPAVGFKQKSSDAIRGNIHGSLRDLFDAAYGDVFQVSAAAAANPDQKTEEPEPKDKKPSKK